MIRSESVYYWLTVTNKVILYTGLMSACLWESNVDSRFWQC